MKKEEGQTTRKTLKHWQQSRQTFIRLEAGEEKTPLQQQHVRLEKKRLLEAELLHKEIFLFFRWSQHAFTVIIFADRTEMERRGKRMRHLTLCAEKAEVPIRGRPRIRLLDSACRACILRTWARKRQCLRVFVWTLPVCVCDKTVITAGLSSGLGRRMGKRKQSSAREEASW